MLDLHDLVDYYPDCAGHLDLAIRGIIGLDAEAGPRAVHRVRPAAPDADIDSDPVPGLAPEPHCQVRLDRGRPALRAAVHDAAHRQHRRPVPRRRAGAQHPPDRRIVPAARTQGPPSHDHRTLRNQVDKLWTEFWTGGITNPLTVIEQISFLMFSRLLDIAETRAEKRAAPARASSITASSARSSRICAGRTSRTAGRRDAQAASGTRSFRISATLGDSESTFAEYMKRRPAHDREAQPAGLGGQHDRRPAADRGDTKGDLYEYLLSKLTTAGINGQFRTPRHIIRLMVDLLEPKPNEVVGDPACGTAGFLVGVMQHLLEKYSSPEGVIVHEDGQKTYTRRPAGAVPQAHPDGACSTATTSTRRCSASRP